MIHIYITYSKDSQDHMDRVQTLADQLKSDGYRCVLDLDINGTPEEGWPMWRERQISTADIILVVCTAQYQIRGDTTAGAAWDSTIIYSNLSRENNPMARYVPIFLGGVAPAWLPQPLRAGTWYRADHSAGYAAMCGLIGRLTSPPDEDPTALGSEAPAADPAVSPELESLTAGLCLDQGRYRLETRLGLSDLTETWSALDTSSREKVVIKLLNHRHRADNSRVQQFFRAAAQMASCSHPGVVPILEKEKRCDNRFWFVTAFIPGGDLHQAVLGQSLDPHPIAALILKAGETLAVTHGRGLIHGGLKPTNILLDQEGRPVLTDFALRTPGLNDAVSGSMRNDLFTAPQLMADVPDLSAAADVFGLALTAAFCHYGKPLPTAVLEDCDLFINGLPIEPEYADILCDCATWESAKRVQAMTSFCGNLALYLETYDDDPPVAVDAPPPRPQADVSAPGLHEPPADRGLPQSTEDLLPTDAVAVIDPQVSPKPAILGRAVVGVLLAAIIFLGVFSVTKESETPRELTVSQAALDAGDVKRFELFDGVFLDMVYIPPGRFMMGSPEYEPGRSEGEDLHEVEISRGYWIAQTEITQSVWEAVMGDNPSRIKGPDLPVEMVSWDHVQEFAARINGTGDKEYRLPTEAEWEYACRAGTRQPYSFEGGSDALFLHGNYCDDLCDIERNRSGDKDRFAQIAPVKSYQANPWGLYDMHGNLSEHVADSFQAYPSGSVVDPVGGDAGLDLKVQRGGNWTSLKVDCRSARRVAWPRDAAVDWVGFRLVRDLDP